MTFVPLVFLCAQVVFRRSAVLQSMLKSLHRQGAKTAKQNPARQAVLRELRALRGSVVKSPQFRPTLTART